MKHVGRRPLGRWTTWAASVVAVAAMVGTGVATGSASAAGSDGVTSNSINIGATVPLTGAAAPGYSEIAPAMTAVFNWVNAHGGVDGRKIHYNYVDDAYNPSNTATQTRKLVLQDGIFADVGSLGTPTQLAVEKFLNTEKVPQLFVESGCNCWSEPKTAPYTFGWQPPYTVDGKILGNYIKSHFAGKKIGYLYQDDEFGQDVVKGLDMELPSSQVVSRQTYNVATLSGPLTTQIAQLQSAGAQVVVLATIPAATALAMLPAATLGYSPQWVVDAVGADPPTVGPLLSSFTQSATHSSTEAQAAVGLLNGVITNAYIPPEGETSNAWVKVSEKLLQDYAPDVWSKYGLDGNTEYGVALAYTFVQALQKAGKNLTRQGLVNAIESSGAKFITPGFVSPSYSKSSHFGFEGEDVVQISSSAPPITVPSGSYPGVNTLTGVYTTNPGKGPVKAYTGKVSSPPSSLTKTA
jgi:ABC-type branched-subunit amino acid transport system substrate-binding protein